MYVQRNIDARSGNHFCCGKSISIIYSECVFVALGKQQAMRMHRILLFSVACSALPYFEHKICVLIFSTTFVRNISHSKKN